MNAKRAFSYQFRLCNSDGTCQHMSKEKHDSMPKSEQKNYAKHKRFMNMKPEYFGPRGPLFCGVKPGICSSCHCPLKWKLIP